MKEQLQKAAIITFSSLHKLVMQKSSTGKAQVSLSELRSHIADVTKKKVLLHNVILKAYIAKGYIATQSHHDKLFFSITKAGHTAWNAYLASQSKIA